MARGELEVRIGDNREVDVNDDDVGVRAAARPEDKLYIGPLAFKDQNPKFAGVVRYRTENILNERNPA